MFGYQYALVGFVSGKSSTYGQVTTAENYKMFIFDSNAIPFTSWDSVVDDSFNKLSSAVYSALRCSPLKQNVTNSNKTINAHGETTLKVTGDFKSDDGEKQYIMFYYVTEDNFIRFCLGLVEDNYNELNDAIDTVIENLKKAE